MTVHGPQASLTKIQQASNHSVPAYRRTGALQIAVRLLTELERGAQALQCCVSVRYGTGQKGPVRVSSCLLLRASPLWSDRGEALVMKSRSHHLLFLLIATGNCRAGTQVSCIFRTWEVVQEIHAPWCTEAASLPGLTDGYPHQHSNKRQNWDLNFPSPGIISSSCLTRMEPQEKINSIP